MAQTQVLQRRIRSVKNAKQITKALEVVAASRMRRVVDAVEGSRAYGQIADEIMRRIAGSPEAQLHPLFAPTNPGNPALYIVFTSDRGQAGAFNSNIFNATLTAMKEERGRSQVIAFGRKGSRFFAKLHDIDLIGDYQNLADVPDVNVFAPVAETLEDLLRNNKVSQVKVVYTEFVSPLTQKPKLFPLLPVDPTLAEGEAKTVYEFEPDIGEVLEEAIKLYFESRLMQARIESAASEHAMRMVAMGNANRNASDLIDGLTLELNATRQAAITQEIAEIVGGAEAIAA